jgi:hypothetical protein
MADSAYPTPVTEEVALTLKGFFLTAAGLFDSMGGRIQSKPGNPQAKPAADDLFDLFDDHRIRQIQIRFVTIKQMTIELSGLIIPLPDAVFLAGKDRLVAIVHRRIRPDEIIAISAGSILLRLHEPWMQLAGVLQHQLDDDAHAALIDFVNQQKEIILRAEARIDHVVIAHVIAAVKKWRTEYRQQPKRANTQGAQMVEAFDDA